MTTRAAAPVPIVVHVDTSGARLAMDAWPDRTTITDEVIRVTDPRCLTFRYPYLTLRLLNGHAVYRADTCERGVWVVDLVEGHVAKGEQT